MSAFAGPQIASDGLLFAYDMGSVNKSWKGTPTTNLLTNTVPTSATGYTRSGGTGTVTFDTDTSSVYWTQTAYATWGSYMYFGPQFNGTLDTGSSYTISFEWKNTSDAGLNSPYYQLVQGNGQSAAISINPITSYSVYVGDGWYRFSYTFVPANTGVSAYNRVITSGANDTTTDVLRFYIRKV